MSDAGNLYEKLIEWVFDKYWSPGATEFVFSRDDIEEAVSALSVDRPKNIGDVLYSFRFRRPLPEAVRGRAPEGLSWVIKANGRSSYRFAAVPRTHVEPTEGLLVIEIPDATPEIIVATALSDEQALLALVRYNRLIDLFLGVTAYSLQNHLRTSAVGIGQAEIDEIYVAVDSDGKRFVLPVQAKGGSDKIGYTQVDQDLAVCTEKFQGLAVRPIAVQFMRNGVVALFELTFDGSLLVVERERHYRLTRGARHSLLDVALQERLLARLEGDSSEWSGPNQD